MWIFYHFVCIWPETGSCCLVYAL